MRTRLLRTLLALTALSAPPLAATSAEAAGDAIAVLVATGFTYPMTVSGPLGDRRLYVVERAGRIRVVKGAGVLAAPFLDLSSQVSTTGEGGLLDLAFPPDYASSGLFYVHFIDTAGDTRIVRYGVSANPDVANSASARNILTIDQPAGSTNHKAGSIHFGPDGFFWFPTGDGGGANDPNENAQNRQSLLGKVLRLDVGPVFAAGSLRVSGQIYRIPASNPFAGSTTTRPEIWALGLRNPYRSSFDPEQGDLWLTDVGQDAFEEVNLVPGGAAGGANFGWDVMEGTLCNPNDPAPAPPCNSPVFTPPLFEYDQSGGNCAIIGGHVYRTAINALSGHYFFGDFCTGRIFSMDPARAGVTDRTAQLGTAGAVPFSLVGFGTDGLRRLYIVHSGGGSLYRIDPEDAACSDGVDNDGDGFVDFPADVGCTSASGATEVSVSCGIGPELAVGIGVLAALRRRARRS